jgi:DNA primase
MAAKPWIDYKQLKDALDFTAVLALYNVALKGEAAQLQGFCPLPTHVHKRGDKPKSPSFSANAEKKVFQCFGCGATGNVIDLACRLDNLDPENPDHFRQTATKLAKHFGIATERVPADKPGKKATAGTTATPAKEAKQAPAKPALPEIVNPPLGFELKASDFAHPYLLERGFSEATTARFGLGFCEKGMMKDRIAIPIHNLDGELVAYAGRIVDDEKINADCPRYLFPGDREKNGVRYLFKKSGL